jgi:hypothetical protein
MKRKYKKSGLHIFEKIISDGEYMLNRENTFCEDFPDEFVTEEVFSIATRVVSILVNHKFTDIEMYHSGFDVGINGKQISIEVSKNNIAGYFRMHNYKPTPNSSNVIKFNIDIEKDFGIILHHIIFSFRMISDRKET